jgi:hypothetical protein
VTPTRAAAAAVLVVGAAACARRTPGPADTLAAFGAAVERQDTAAAYALTSKDFRARVPLEAFRAELDAGGAETRAVGRNLRTEAGRGRMKIEVQLPPSSDLDVGQPIVLVEEDGSWRVEGHPLEAWSQATPRAALRSFVRALEQHRYDVVLRLCPTRHRVGLSIESLRVAWEGDQREENARLLARLRAAIRAPIIEAGDEAHMPYGDRSEVRFVREDGRWKIEDPD